MVVVALAVAVRRRRVVARRAQRRWARVHPSTAPGRSIADLRRTGELPAVPARPGSIYDHELEPPPLVDTGELPVS